MSPCNLFPFIVAFTSSFTSPPVFTSQSRPVSFRESRHVDRRQIVRMQLALGSKLKNECLQRLEVAGSRAVIFVIPDDESSVQEIESFSSIKDELRAMECAVVCVRPLAGATERREEGISFRADEPFILAGRKTTVRRELNVPILTTPRGLEPKRLTFVLDIAGVVRGVFENEEECTSQANFALECCRGMEAAPDTEMEIEFKKRAVITSDGQRVALRPSAVGRMRERQAQEKAAREAAGQVGQGVPSIMLGMVALAAVLFLSFPLLNNFFSDQ